MENTREYVEAIACDRPFIVDSSKVNEFWKAVREQKGAKRKLLEMAKRNRKNRLSKE